MAVEQHENEGNAITFVWHSRWMNTFSSRAYPKKCFTFVQDKNRRIVFDSWNSGIFYAIVEEKGRCSFAVHVFFSLSYSCSPSTAIIHRNIHRYCNCNFNGSANVREKLSSIHNQQNIERKKNIMIWKLFFHGSLMYLFCI